jgi:NAD(P)-dependent dehydrogenase (short-subunit alcohol dehydrogenase family)
MTGELLGRLLSFEGRCVVVTGGGRGLGAAIVRRFLEAGAAVVSADLAGTEREALAADDRLQALDVDVRAPESVAALADAAVEFGGGIDVWVNNAGIFPVQPALEMTAGDWDEVQAVNLRGTFLGAVEAARRMDGSPGVVVNVASVNALRARNPGLAHYVASKHGVHGLTKSLALELGPRGIRVLAVAPGHIDTPGVRAMFPPGAEASTADQIPLGRVGVPDDIARVVLFAASGLASYMTGTLLVVDGGSTVS